MALIAWYKLDGNANDSSGNGYNGTVSGVGWIQGKINQAGSFLSSGNKITVSDITNSVMSFSFWYKWEPTLSTWRTIIGRSSNHHHIIFDSSGVLSIWDGSQRTYGYTISDNNWHHYVIIIESASKGYAYVDGSYIGETYTSLNLSTYPVQNIGNWGSNSYPCGHLDDVRIYDHVLSLKEIKLLSQAKVLHYNFNKENDLYDLSGYNNNATIPGTAPTFSEGKIGSGSLYFDPGKYLAIGDIGLSSLTNCTISFWRKSNGTNSWLPFVGHSNSHYLMAISTGNFYHQNAGSPTIYRDGVLSTTDLRDGEWHHYVARNANLSLWTNLQFNNYASGNTTWCNSHFIDDIRIYNTILSEDDIKSLYEERASIDNQGNFFSDEIIETKYKPLQLNYTSWTVGSGSSTGFNQNGLTAENVRISSIDPWNKTTVIWETRPSGDSNADGGWNTVQFVIDNTKLYRFSVWVKRITTVSSGNFYLGIYGYTSGGSSVGMVRMDGGGPNTNSYWDCPRVSSLPYNEWILVVGHVYPYTETYTGKHPDSGRWNLSGIKTATVSCNIGTGDIKWDSTHGRALHRTYHYYSTDTACNLQFVYPRVDIIDGSEPTIADLIAGVDSVYLDYIVSKGSTNNIPLSILNTKTYISNLNEVDGTSSTQQAELTKNGIFYINGEFNEVD